MSNDNVFYTKSIHALIHPTFTFNSALYRPACGGSSLTNEKDHHYFLNRFVCVGEFFDG